MLLYPGLGLQQPLVSFSGECCTPERIRLQAAWLPAFWGETYYLMADRLQFSSLHAGSLHSTTDTDLYE